MTRFNRRTRLAASLLLAAAAAACTDNPIAGPGRPSYVISDAVHSSGKPHFYFLPPMVPNPTVAGTFDPGLSPEVSICLWVADACDGELARYTMTSGAGSETIRVSTTDQHYIVNWHTGDFDLSAAATYRIRILVEGVELGFADVDVVGTARELRNVNTGEYIPLLDGRTLPIKFRVEQGFVARIDVVPMDATIQTGATQQFVAELYDLHGGLIVGPPVSWSSGNAGVATVDGSGLASAVNDGSTTISAAAAGVTGSASLTVEGGVIFVETGRAHSCALDSSGLAYCWGINDVGQLGRGFANGLPSPVPMPVSGGHSFVALTSSESHTCGLTAAGQAWCWGRNFDGQLGDGSAFNVRATPVQVRGGLTFTQIAAGFHHTCGIEPSGRLHCWGYNGQAQLGFGGFSPLQQSVPFPVNTPHLFSSVTLGLDHSCGITTAGQAVCWGANNQGQAGNLTVVPATILVPTAVAAPVPNLVYTSLSAGRSHTCGITTSGQTWCWGRGLEGQLGNGLGATSRMPVLVSGSFISVSTGHTHTCGVDTSNQAWCWGDNFGGQLGDGTTTQRRAPVLVAGVLSFTTVTGGELHTCGLTTSRAVYCWGRNSAGQLGDGTTTQRLVPTAVVGL